MTGRPKVYLIFTGSQWGAQSTDINGDVTLSGDPLGAAPYLQEFFKGLGTDNDQWSGILTQYCQGVSRGTEFCSDNNTQHIGYPNGGNALAGVWVQENLGPLPMKVNKSVFSSVALQAALHFGNNTWQKNRSAVYILLPPPGTDPDDYLHKNWCATHTWDGGLDLLTDGGPVHSRPFDPVSLIILPYVFEKPGCSQSAVNPGSAGVLDGFSIMASHEYAETLTDPFPPAALPVQGGWWGPGLLNELGDKCQGKRSYPVPAPQNLQLATGNFPVQAIWSNNAHACVFVHPVVRGGGIVNGGFDSGGTGLFSGWTTAGAASVPVASGRTDAFALQLGSTSPTDGLSTASQWFTAPPGVNTVSFWYKISCPDPGYDWASATLADTAFHTTTEMLPATCEQDAQWRRAAAPVIPGHPYTLTLRNFDDNHPGDPTYTLFDDVRLMVTQTGIVTPWPHRDRPCSAAPRCPQALGVAGIL